MEKLLFSVFPSENFIDLGLKQFGWEQCEPSHSFGPVARNNYLFHYVLSGNGSLIADDRKGLSRNYTVKAGQGFMLCPGQIATYFADRDTPWEYTWVEFDGLRVGSMLSAAGLSVDSPIYRPRRKELAEKMRDEMLYIAQNGSAPPFHLIGHLYLFFDYLVRSCVTEKASDGAKLRDSYIHEALVYIEHNYHKEITVEGIAAACGLNRSYFGKIFKESMGKTPQEFLMHYRMSHAAELLKLTQMPVGDIGKAVGYEDSMHFSRAFKSVYGVSPRVWRGRNAG